MAGTHPKSSRVAQRTRQKPRAARPRLSCSQRRCVGISCHRQDERSLVLVPMPLGRARRVTPWASERTARRQFSTLPRTPPRPDNFHGDANPVFVRKPTQPDTQTRLLLLLLLLLQQTRGRRHHHPCTRGAVHVHPRGRSPSAGRHLGYSARRQTQATACRHSDPCGTQQHGRNVERSAVRFPRRETAPDRALRRTDTPSGQQKSGCAGKLIGAAANTCRQWLQVLLTQLQQTVHGNKRLQHGSEESTECKSGAQHNMHNEHLHASNCLRSHMCQCTCAVCVGVLAPRGGPGTQHMKHSTSSWHRQPARWPSPASPPSSSENVRMSSALSGQVPASPTQNKWGCSSWAKTDHPVESKPLGLAHVDWHEDRASAYQVAMPMRPGAWTSIDGRGQLA
jgi:hypothetical protein